MFQISFTKTFYPFGTPRLRVDSLHLNTSQARKIAACLDEMGLTERAELLETAILAAVSAPPARVPTCFVIDKVSTGPNGNRQLHAVKKRVLQIRKERKIRKEQG